MKKAIQIISIGLAAYNLYILVNDFLETPTGQALKSKAVEYGEPVIEKAKEVVEDYMEKIPNPTTPMVDNTKTV